MKRRHLSTGQRAMIADKLAHLTQGQKKADVEISTSQSEAADLLNVSRESVVHARRVREYGIPTLAQKVEEGEIAVSLAATLTKLPEEKQNKLV